MEKLRNLVVTFFLVLSFSSFGQLKIGDNLSVVGTSSLLELESTNKGLLITRVANIGAITTPVNGMLVYDISENCIKSYQNGAWSVCAGTSLNLGGTAVFTVTNCSSSSNGTMTAGTLVGEVSQVITVDVTTAGTYNISAAGNGVTFNGSGYLTTGSGIDIVLKASGTPITAGSTTFVSPVCSFTRSIGSSFLTSNCSTSTGTFPATVAFGPTSMSLNVAKTSSTDLGSGAITNLCTLNPGGTQTTLSETLSSATITFSIPLMNVQVYTSGNDGTAENQEGLSVSASLNGVPVPVQLVGFGGSCTSNFVSSQSGNVGIIRTVSTAPTSGVFFNVSSAGPYDQLILTRVSVGNHSGTNAFALRFCNAAVEPGVIFNNSTCAGKPISVSKCSSVSGASINDLVGTAQGIEYDWTGATGFISGGVTRALIEIGGQCWYRGNASNIPSNFNPEPTWVASTDNGWSGVYSGGPFAYEGRLYQWSAAMNGSISERAQGICASGWHVPSDCEWMYLEYTLGMSVAEQQIDNANANVRASGNVGIEIAAYFQNGNISGFNALAAGYREDQSPGGFLSRGSFSVFWTSSQSSVGFANRRLVSSLLSGVSRINAREKAASFSVRCLKD